MSTHPDQSSASLSRLRATWRATTSTLQAANRATHRLLSWLLVAIVVAYFAFCAAFLALRYAVLPNIDRYQPEVARVASLMLNRPVSISGIEASWSGLNPRLRLRDLVIHDDEGNRALVLPEVSATLSWWSVLGQLRLYSLEVLRPDLEIERDPAGRLTVAGIRVDTDKADDGRGLDWLLAQREIVIRGGAVRWIDHQRKAPELALTDISLVLRNQWRSHRAALRATPPAELAAPLDLRAEFTRPPFARNSADVGQWSGELYADWRNTHLGAWKPYLDLPWELAGGNGALRAWLSFSRGVVQNVTADLDLRDVSARLADGLEPLRLVEASGRISAGETPTDLKQQLFSFGEQGHTLTLSDFSLRTEQGSVLPRTTASHRYVAARGSKQEQHEIKIRQLDLEALARLATHLPLSADERRMLDEFAPRGELRDFSASWEGSTPGSGDFRLSGHFSRLALRQQLPVPGKAGSAAIPGFDGLSGDIDANQNGGKVRLDAERATLNLAGYLKKPTLFLDELALDGSWTFRNGRRQLAFRIADLRFAQSGLTGRAEGMHLLPWPLASGQPGEIDLNAQFPAVELTRLVGFLPADAGADTHDWMANGIIDGVANDVQLTLKGPLDKFPFPAARSGTRQAGTFRITGRLANARISPAPAELAADRRTPLWPRIEGIDGRITLDGSRLHIHADSARTQGIALAGVDAVIPDLFADSPVLDIGGSASGSLQGLLGYVNSTPIAGWIDHFTEETKALGNARLALKLQVPLSAGGPGTTVQGSLRFSGNEVQLWRSLPVVQQLNGELGFSERGFQLPNLAGILLGGPVVMTGGTQRDGSTLVRLDGAVSADGIARFASAPAAKRIARRLAGTARYGAAVRVKNQRTDVTVESTLAGMAIDLPAPLNKAAGDSLPLRVAVVPVGLFDQSVQSEEIRATLGKLVSARYLRQRPGTKQADWQLVRGGIGVGAPPPLADTGVAMSVNLPALNLDAWRALNASVSEAAPGEGPGSNAGMPGAAYLTPESVNLRSKELTLASRVFENVSVSAARMRSGWQVGIQSDEIVGRASWEDPLAEKGAGKLSARLSSLKIEQSSAADVTDLLSGKKSFTELPGLDIVADSFELRGLKLGRFELAATNAGLANGPGREWRISRLLISNPGATMRGSGRWVTTLTDNQTTLNYDLEIGDAGQLLDRLGFERTLRGGKGQMDGELSWRGDPTAFDFPTMSGQLTLKLGAGQFLRADPGVAKLLGVMSLQSLPRRLTLDFRDIFSEGFAFDTIASSATIARGTLKTDSFKMRGPNGVVLMDGTVELADETQNLNVVVIPELNATGASVVYGLAVNPVIGLGSFLAQYFLKNPLSQALAQEYQITGPWRDPVVRKSSSRRKVAAEQERSNP
ncbi:MAG: TIGR02099 family protein [Burkholderiaceae bacterium]|nr:TIGR02099 family protein [Burkholderiaceae bacterium]